MDRARPAYPRTSGDPLFCQLQIKTIWTVLAKKGNRGLIFYEIFLKKLLKYFNSYLDLVLVFEDQFEMSSSNNKQQPLIFMLLDFATTDKLYKHDEPQNQICENSVNFLCQSRIEPDRKLLYSIDGPKIPVCDDDISFNEQMHKLIYIRDSFHVILFKY